MGMSISSVSQNARVFEMSIVRDKNYETPTRCVGTDGRSGERGARARYVVFRESDRYISYGENTTRYIIQVVSKPILSCATDFEEGNIARASSIPRCIRRDPTRPQPHDCNGSGEKWITDRSRIASQPAFSATISGGFNGGSAVKRARY